MLKLVVMGFVAMLVTACVDEATPPGPDAAVLRPNPAPPACVVGWHPEGDVCVPD